MVQIFTDSAADFEPNELERMNVNCIPLSVFFGDREYLENIDISKQQFYTLLDRENIFPHTSQPSPHTFERALTSAKENGEVLAELLKKRGYDIPDSRIINVGAAIGSHIGPNACGIVYISK